MVLGSPLIFGIFPSICTVYSKGFKWWTFVCPYTVNEMEVKTQTAHTHKKGNIIPAHTRRQIESHVFVEPSWTPPAKPVRWLWQTDRQGNREGGVYVRAGVHVCVCLLVRREQETWNWDKEAEWPIETDTHTHKKYSRKQQGKQERHGETYKEKETERDAYCSHTWRMREQRGSQAFCGLARLEWWDLAGYGPLASLLKREREKKITVKKWKGQRAMPRMHRQEATH